jgi:maltooligosyltrehalose trehalohydrolase
MDDDIHHAIHAAVGGERQGYYADFGSLEALAQTLKHGYFHAGTYSSFRHRRHGRPLDTASIPATRLLAYTLTHDQVGNRAVGDRPSQILTFGQLAVKAALALGSPYTGMLFMGEEWGSSSPFQFFSSHPEQELARATVEGRRREFAEHGWNADEIPDPQDPATFKRSKLNWDEIDDGQHGHLRQIYRQLIALRHNEPDLTDPWLDHMRVDYDEDAQWIVMHRGSLAIACNLGVEAVDIPVTGEGRAGLGRAESRRRSRRGWTGHSFVIVREREVARAISPKLGAQAHFRRSEQVAIRGRTRLQRLDVKVGRPSSSPADPRDRGRTQLDADQGPHRYRDCCA